MPRLWARASSLFFWDSSPLPCFSWHHLALLAIAIWSFSRAYYFAFYVIEKDLDHEFR
ncbi:MAG: hypothetical protein OSB65_02865 [Roseibacillus sp.]|nr:hypothetical protein [Roseibacillus sp.]